MTRIACLRIPNLPLASELRAHPELLHEPFAIATGGEPRSEIIAVSPVAQHAGVRPFSSVVHARARCSALQVRVLNPARERAARDALLDIALSCSPRAQIAPPSNGAYAAEGAAFLDASGCDALFGSESGLASALVARAERIGFSAIAAVAASPGVARVATRTLTPPDSVCVIARGTEERFLAPLPLDLIEPDDRTHEALTRFGVRRVGDLLRLPERALATRVGPEALRLLALARGRERFAELPVPRERRLEEAVDLDYAIERLEPLRFILHRLLVQLVQRLDLRHLACGELELGLGLEGGRQDIRRVGIAAPTLDVRVLERLVCLCVEQRAPAAPVQSVALFARGRPGRADQLDLFRPAGPAPDKLSHTLAELASLCRTEHVGSPAVADRHHPHAFATAPFGEPSPTDDAAPAAIAPMPLALRALRPPIPAQVRAPHGHPEWVRSAAANGEVLECAGPWRTSGGWWAQEERFALDSYDVQTSDGTLSRLCFDRVARKWLIDAVYD